MGRERVKVQGEGGWGGGGGWTIPLHWLVGCWGLHAP